MLVKDIITALNAQVLTSNNGIDLEINGCFTGDLLSVVMAKAQPGNVWITIQSHLNIVAVASFCEVPLIIVAEDFDLEEGVADKANEEDIVIVKMPLSAYETAVSVAKLLGDAK